MGHGIMGNETKVPTSDLPSTRAAPVPESDLPSYSPFIYPRQRATPSSPETKEAVRSLSERFGEYMFGEPEREEYSPVQTAEAAGITGGLSAAGPQILQKGGRLISKIPGAPARFIGGGMTALGEALGTVPLTKRILGGTLGGAAVDVTGQAGEMMGIPRIYTLPIEFAAGGSVALAVSKAENALGIGAGSLSKKLREEGLQKTAEFLDSLGISRRKSEQEVQNILKAIQTDKSVAQKELTTAQKTQRQLSEQETKARQRAEQAQAITPEITAKQTVADKTRRASALAMNDAQAAKLPVDQANQLANDASKLVTNTKAAADKLEQAMINQPGVTKEQFGKLVQSVSKNLQKEGLANRKRIAGIDQVIESKANVISVPTKPVDMSINAIKENIKDPSIRSFLDTVQGELNQGKGLTLKQADSLKKYIDDVVDSKEFGISGRQSQFKTVALRVKDLIQKQMEIHNKDYFAALQRFREMSRPLDIVERNGALKKVVAQDPMSRDYLLTEAEVIGHVIQKANAGNPVFTRLIQENPAVKDVARLYYTRELFGSDVAPTVSQLATFLKTNESSLKQLGLYGEFADMRAAKKAAQEAVDFANRAESEAKAVVKEAERGLTAVEREAAAKKSLAERAESRLSEALKTTEPIETILKRKAAETKPVGVKTAQQIANVERKLADLDKEAASVAQKAAKTAEAQTAIEQEFASLYNDLSKPVTKSRDVPGMVTKLADRLLQLNHIDQEERNRLVNLAAKNSDLFADTSTARRVLSGMAIAIGVPSLAMKFYGTPSASSL